MQTPEERRAYMKVWRARNPAKRREYQERWRATNPAEFRDTVRRAMRKWSNDNPEQLRANAAKRRASRLHRTPAWADHAATKAIYQTCPVGHHVDHIIPLLGKNVCGLHVHYNLQHLPAVDNMRKGNRYDG